MNSIGITGGGIAGLLLAYFLTQKNPSSTIYLIDQNPLDKWLAPFPTVLDTQATTPRSGGMIAPFSEAEYHQPEMSKVWDMIHEIYESIENHLGKSFRYLHPTIEATTESSEVGYLKRHYEFLKKHYKNEVLWLEGSEVQSRYPFLSSEVKAAIVLPEEFHIDIPLFLQALISFLHELPNIHFYYNHKLIAWKVVNKKVKVSLQSLQESNGPSSSLLEVDHLFLATGIYSALPQIQLIPIRGQMVALELDPKIIPLDCMIRIRSRAYGRGYIIPKGKLLLLGSTSETKGFREEVTFGGLLDILRRSYDVIPALYELPVLKTWAGLRPASKSFHPIFFHYQNTPIAGLNGLYRHGIMLAPLLSKLFVQWIEMKQLPPPFNLWIQTLNLNEQPEATLI